MEFILVIAKILILFTGVFFSGVFIERLILNRFEVNLFASYILGVSFLHVLVLLGLQLSTSLIIILIIGLIGLIKYYNILGAIHIDKWLFLLSSPIIIAVSFQMIWYWDAVVMWFFHAKVIAYANVFSMNIYTEPTPAHPEYPKLLPILSALVSKITSVWNESLPKTSILYLMFGVFIGFSKVHYFSKKEKRVIYFMLLGLMGIHSYSGYLDGWLSIYSALCCLFIINYKKHEQEIDLVNSICALCFLPMLKNEGLALALILFAVLIFGNFNKLFENFIYKIELLFLILLPTIIWAIIKYKYNTSYFIFDETMIDRLYFRLTSEMDTIIYYFIIFSNLIYFIIFPVFIYLLSKLNKIVIGGYVWIPVQISISYLILLICVFLVDRSGLVHFLEFGVRRVTMPIMMFLFIFNLMVLKELKIYDNLIKKRVN